VTWQRGQEGHYSSSFNSYVTWLRHSAGSGTSIIQYWISVTPTHLAIVLNADGGSSWSTSGNLIAKVTQDDPSNYGTCWLLGYPGSPYQWYRIGTHSLIEMALAQPGFHDNGRDWQNGQGRLDYHSLEGYGAWYQGDWGGSFSVPPRYLQSSTVTGSTQSSYMLPVIPVTRDRTSLPLLVDQRWFLGGYGLMDSQVDTTDTTARAVGMWRPRGYVAEGIWYLATGGFNQGDELTDTATGKKYLLWLAGSYTFPGVSFGAWGLALEEA